MKIKAVFFFLAFLAVFSSCRKEDDPYNSDYFSLVHYHHYHLRGIVIDTLTGIPVQEAKISQFIPYFIEDSYGMGKTTAVGWYTGDYTWGGDERYVHAPSDSTDIYIYAYTNNQCGKVKVKLGQLRENGLFVMPPLYVKPIGYLKTHIKDTSGVNSPLIYFSGSNNIIEPVTILNSRYAFWSAYPAGHVYDTTFLCRVFPNSNVILTTYYGTATYMDHSLGSRTVFVPSGDTSSVNIFY